MCMSCVGLPNSKFSWLSRPNLALGAKNSDVIPANGGDYFCATSSAKVEQEAFRARGLLRRG